MQVCLISLPSPFLIDDLNYVNLGVLYISAYLKEHGVKGVQVVDLATHDPIPEVDAEIVGISSTTPQFPIAVEVLKALKKSNPKAAYAIGGPHATCHPQSCIEAGFDKVVRGEGEKAMLKIVRDGRSTSRGEIFQLEFLGSTEINFLPDRDAINMSRYGYSLYGKRSTNVMTSRGCPFNCAFCCKTWGRTVRYVDPHLVAEEIKLLRDKYGFEGIIFFDDEMNFNLEHLSEICKLIKPLGMVWRCLLRAEPLSLDLLRKMRRSGCVEVQVGVESGDDQILRTIKKGTTVKKNLRAVRLIKEAGIMQKVLLMIGNPSESQKTVNRTRRFLRHAKKIDPDLEFDLMMFTPYPLSDIWEHTENYDIQFDKEGMDFGKAMYKQPNPLDPNTCLVRTSHLTTEELIKLQKEIFVEFEEWGVKLAHRREAK